MEKEPCSPSSCKRPKNQHPRRDFVAESEAFELGGGSPEIQEDYATVMVQARMRAILARIRYRKLKEQSEAAVKIQSIARGKQDRRGAVIEMEAAECFWLRCCEEMSARVVRSLNTKEYRARVRWQTRPGSAKNGEDYVSRQGLIEFAEGEVQ